ncbi:MULTISPECIES: hypothetical protein [unclassified Rathayibacter]|nr:MULTISPECIES: hypothetical protein [unclassified Rathayibacter]
MADEAVSAPLVGITITEISTLEVTDELPCELGTLGRRHFSD